MDTAREIDSIEKKKYKSDHEIDFNFIPSNIAIAEDGPLFQNIFTS